MGKKLTRSSSDCMLSGVCGGIAGYLEIDSTIVRLVYALVTICSVGFPCIILYILMHFIVPKD